MCALIKWFVFAMLLSARCIASSTQKLHASHSSRSNARPPASKSTEAALSIVTWNLAECTPLVVDCNTIYECVGQSQVICVGLQEVESLSPRRSESRRSKLMRKRIRGAFSTTHKCISQSTLGQTQLLVFVRKGSAIDIIAEWDVTCGIGNVVANKGALGLVLRVGSLNIGIITAHLAAHQSKVQSRNDDFTRIMASSAKYVRGLDGLLFGGDLNYRLDLMKEEVDLSLETNHEELLGYDQVRCS